MCIFLIYLLLVPPFVLPHTHKPTGSCKDDQNIFPSRAPVIKRTQNGDEIHIGFLSNYEYSKGILGALPLAIQAVNKDPNLLPGKTLIAHPFNIGSSELSSYPIKLMTEMWQNKNVSAFIGPDDKCTNEALVASAWNIPMISYRCADSKVSDKKVFNSFARTLAPASKVSKSIVSVLIEFGWTKFTIVHCGNHNWEFEVAQAVKMLAESKNMTVIDVLKFLDYIPANIHQMNEIVEKTYRKTRIYIFIGEFFALIDFVRCLQNYRLLETGEYMVVSVDDEVYDGGWNSKMERSYLDPYISHIPMLQESFRSVLKLTSSYPLNSNFSKLFENIRRLSGGYPFCVPFHEKISPKLSIPVYAAHLFDSIMVYARAATEVLRDNGDISNGTLIMERIFNRSYKSIQGFDVHIDAFGDAEGNFTLLSLQESSDNTYSMQPVGYFLFNSPQKFPELKYIKNKKIKWLKGWVPRCEPMCGFLGEYCKPKPKDWRFIIFGLILVLFIGVVFGFFIKHYRYEQKIRCLLWKVEMKDVTIINLFDLPDGGQRPRNSRFNGKNSLEEDENKRAHTSIGLYRSHTVAIKRIHKKSIDLTRNIRKELKQMRELRHENIVTFIGCSVDQGFVAILTGYCARGSLENVLANKDLYLDHIFISSLVSDIIKGLIYLHDSEIISHGSLKSSNCLVDSRWVCQITDFGLHEFKYGQDETSKIDGEYRRHFWTAPELLRDINRPARGTQKGDVYAFAVILFEIFGRKGPVGETSLSDKEILERLKNPGFGCIFRPSLQHLDDVPHYVKQCVVMCWQEDFERRPDIRLVRVKLKELQTGLKPNIFDNMLSIMEKYSYNLETLVGERTKQLSEEKKKTEALLLRMLPKTVAESLKRGEKVAAESFECVTIFFSDLVGFTELCSESTPFEVVEMLNDLYTCCDSIIASYDVYKVETIGDGYMVVSGAPIRNGDRHVGEIALLALHLLQAVAKLEIRHRPGELFQIRIGIHSGEIVAGVVGLSMPRWCLFGDNVNTASRMESSGEARKIHISLATYTLLKKIGGFKFEDRGIRFIKGKGDMRTFWLLGENEHSTPTPPDLICNMQVEESYNPSIKSIQGSRFVRAEFATNLIQNTVSDQHLPLLQISRVTPSSHCCMCQMESFTPNSSIDSLNLIPMAEVCACTLQRSMFLQKYYDYSHLRVPRSAPQITFKQ